MIYIAGSFASAEERKELNEMIKWVRAHYLSEELFIPMEHFIPNSNDKDDEGNYVMPNHVWGRKVFEMDKKAIDNCRLVVALHRGRISGTGTAWELGYAYGIGKPIVLFVSDNTEVASVMCYNSATIVLGNQDVEQK